MSDTEADFAYTVKIASERDLRTLEWLNDRGYDAAFLEMATFLGREKKSDGSDGAFVYGLSEPDAWQVRDEYEKDPDAFLTCNGSDTLGSALFGFLDSIV